MKTLSRPVKTKSARMPGPLGKVFKSGNSAALRLPAALNVAIGKSYVLTATPSGFMATELAALTKRRKAVAALFGSAPDFPLRDE